VTACTMSRRVEASRQVPGDAEGLLAGRSETVADNE